MRRPQARDQPVDGAGYRVPIVQPVAREPRRDIGGVDPLLMEADAGRGSGAPAAADQKSWACGIIDQVLALIGLIGVRLPSLSVREVSTRVVRSAVIVSRVFIALGNSSPETGHKTGHAACQSRSRLRIGATCRPTRAPIARKPVFAKIGPGLSLGYRRNVGLAPGWLPSPMARAVAGRKQSVPPMTSRMPTARSILASGRRRIVPAISRAVVKVNRASSFLSPRRSDRYEADLKARGGDTDNAVRVRLHLPDALGRKTVALLTAHDLRQWRDLSRRDWRRPRSIAPLPSAGGARSRRRSGRAVE